MTICGFSRTPPRRAKEPIHSGSNLAWLVCWAVPGWLAGSLASSFRAGNKVAMTTAVSALSRISPQHKGHAPACSAGQLRAAQPVATAA